MVFDLRSFSFEDDAPPPKSFSLKELQVATHNFSRDNFFSERVYGTLYRGRLADGSPVAVKRARTVFECSEEQSETEVQVGRSISAHQNVLRLRGFCQTKKELLLVYPLMINKNLRYHLRLRPDRSTQPLGCTTLMRISLGAARGNFWRALIMHDGNATEGTIQWPVRVSSSSQGEDSADSDSDSPTYRLYEDVYVDTTYADGRVEFIAPEYLHTGKCTLRNDVHAFGKVLLELISGQPPAKHEALPYGENLSLAEWIGGFMSKNELGRLIDPNLRGDYEEEEAEQLLQLALLCADGDPSIRLEMSEVVRMLESQLLGQDPSSRSSWSQSECDSTPYYSIPPSPSEMAL
ncbi:BRASSINOSTEROID INSENSITIVE 1-associated receptor kinase 1-like [Rhodamnia argentea]|uniref:non-specific serine/threonine protein kinase n=1 Tax=Rhodamnia argentea TaxID=178133 RepID=A0A8B8N584_9MYRT|nr:BRASSINOSTEROID INSENSITIVE 1-associated receptor kinase 1-like [Rhodamnia argentea]